jgi:hypothetical protein
VIRCCEICWDVHHLIDRWAPTREIIDYTAMDPATLGGRLRAHGHDVAAARIDPTRGGQIPAPRQLNLPGVDYTHVAGPKHERTCPQQCGYCEMQILARDAG